MYKIIYDRVNESFLTGMKYAEIYPKGEPIGGTPMRTLYAFTWKNLDKRVDKWLKKHRYDIPLNERVDKNYY